MPIGRTAVRPYERVIEEKSTMNKHIIAAGAALLILLTMIVGCAPATSATEATEAQTEEPTATLTNTPKPSNTPNPSNTPKPTATKTPKPSDTPKPTATNTPKPSEKPTTAAPATKEPTTKPTEQGSAELVPPGQSIWVLDTTASEHGSAAECPAPFQADFYGLVAINTIDNGITWMRAQDGITYTLLRQSPNVYWGTGQSIYPGYTLTISVVFASPTGLGATFVLIDQAVQGCNHYWKYGGTLR